MSLFRKTPEEAQDIHYKGNAVLRMLSYLKPHAGMMAVCLVLVLILTGLELYRPLITGNAIDLYIAGDYAPGEAVEERFRGLLLAAAQYGGALLVTFFCNNRMMNLLQKIGQSIVYEMRRELFEHIESLSMRFFDLTPVGKIVTRVSNDVEAVHELYANILVKLFRNTVKIIGLAVVMLMLDTRMALLSFVMVPLVSVLTLVTRRLSLRANRANRTCLTALNTFLSEHLSGMKIIQIFNREKEKFQEFSQHNQSYYRTSFRAIMVNAVFRPIIVLTSVIAMAIVIAGGSHGVLAGTLSFGTMYIFLQYIKTFFEPIQDLAEQLSTLQSAVASAEKIFTLLDEEPLIHDPEKPTKLDKIQGRIEFKHVWFAYDNENFILRDVSFVIEPGQKVAFVGATGAGKSSILNLIGRYYDIQKGEILIDGVNIRALTRDQIRRAIGQVQQDVFIFTGDIKSNIRLREEGISDAAIEKAAREVNASRFIDRLPDGYGERVTERGSTFSAGQRQLLSFARTLAFDPTILILDEATANIDTETEQWIQEALETLMAGRTTIMVAHRLSTIQHADKIIVMHKGQIRESGTHQELLDQDGIYRKLYQLQLA
ncbi:MAG: ABC transporter ATP-binding protein/permease [Oscillospiraceae bacterium]|jgi:ATP-binding cassette subfamily B protein|nr:ABC transporter ATP-binding protein/permease [Oscillospiraceae bacterium]